MKSNSLGLKPRRPLTDKDRALLKRISDEIDRPSQEVSWLAPKSPYSPLRPKLY